MLLAHRCVCVERRSVLVTKSTSDIYSRYDIYSETDFGDVRHAEDAEIHSQVNAGLHDFRYLSFCKRFISVTVFHITSSRCKLCSGLAFHPGGGGGGSNTYCSHLVRDDPLIFSCNPQTLPFSSKMSIVKYKYT